MRHPFEGINPHPSEVDRPVDPQPTRRSLLGRALCLAAGALAMLVGRNASAQRFPGPRRGMPTTLAVGEEGGPAPPRIPGGTKPGYGATTYALGEEGSRPPVTTYALGEEGARPPMTTYALGEEGQSPRPLPPGRGPYTTQALGEEGGTPFRPTTRALGEEGGRFFPR